MICNKCGNEVNEGAKFCRNCGAPVERPATEKPSAPIETSVIQESAAPAESVANQESEEPVVNQEPSATVEADKEESAVSKEESAAKATAAEPQVSAPAQPEPLSASSEAPAKIGPAAPEAKKKGKKLVVIIVILVVAVVAAAAGIGFFLFTGSPEYKYDKALKSAKQHFAEEEYDDALTFYNEALVWREDSREAQKGVLKTYLKLAEKCYTDGRYEESIEYYDLVLQESKNENAQAGRSQSYLALGKQKYEGGEYKLAYDAFQKVLETDPYNEEAISRLPEINIALGKECYETGQYDEAFDYYEAARAQDALREEIYRGESDIYLQRGEVKQAVALLDEGIAATSAVQLSERKQYIIDNSVAGSEDEYYYSGGASYHREYDEDGNIIREQCYSGCDEQSRKLSIDREYDKDGRLIRYTDYDESGNISYQNDGNTEISYYNENAIRYQVTKDQAVYYGENGNPWITEKHTRNSAGEVTHLDGIGPAGDVYYTADYIYGVDGNVEKYVVTKSINLTWGDEEFLYWPTSCFWEVSGWGDEYEKADDMETQEWILDENGHVTSYWVTGADGAKSGSEYTYDGNGNCLKELTYFKDGTKREEIYTYDSDGNLTEDIVYNNEGRVIYHQESAYIAKDKPSRYIWYSYDDFGNIMGGAESVYNYEGSNLITKSSQDYNGYLSGENYTYDDMGNCTSEVYYDDTNGYYWESYSTYDDRGNCTSQKYYSYGELFSETQYTYDSDGRKTGMASKGKSSSYQEEYRYDEFGEITEIYRDSKLDTMKNYEYIFVG